MKEEAPTNMLDMSVTEETFQEMMSPLKESAYANISDMPVTLERPGHRSLYRPCWRPRRNRLPCWSTNCCPTGRSKTGGPVGAIVQVEPLEAAGDDDGICAGLRVGVGLWTRNIAGGVAVAPVDGDAGSADG